MEPGSWDRFSLWEHQRNALDMSRKYFTSNSRGAALVRMPTGTGKSGVIAVISQCFEEVKCVLVITPWVALRKQIANDIEKRFWNRIGVDPNQFNKKIVRFKPITLDLSVEREVTKIFVCTIQTLQILFNKYPEKYSELQRLISTVIVDEGHREPSPEWAKAIRNLQKPTILFTATPYRNDHKVFNVDPNHIFVYSHHEAVNDRIIREVVFKEEKIEQSPEAFVDSLLEFYHNEFQTLKPTDIDQPRVIVRCETADEVKVIANLIKTKGESVIAIHERFSNSELAGSYKNVPNPDETDVIFWVHQLKLVEGIDNPSFCLLAIYQPFRNARMLVQQIGRIVRNPRLLEGQSAYVFSNSQYMQSAFWRGYCRYERDYESNPRKFEVRTIFEGYVNLQPEYLYFEGNYRKRFVANSDQAYQMFKYKKKCNVYEIANEFSLEELKKSLEDSWEKSDMDIRSISNPDENTCIIGYISYMNSPLLISDCLLEFRVGYSIYRRVNNHLFFYDTHGMTPGYLIENSNKVEPNRLERLFNNETTRLTLISLMNSDLGKHSIRRRVMQAFSIDETAPGLTDHIHFCSNALGYTSTQDKEYIRRYVGFSRSRISDESEQTQDYEHYINWIDSIAHILDIGDKEKITMFERYAAFSDAPKDCTPISILLDIDDVITNYATNNGENKLVMDELCYSINSGEFRVLINNVTYIVEINFDREKKYINWVLICWRMLLLKETVTVKRLIILLHILIVLSHSELFQNQKVIFMLIPGFINQGFR
jgi:superfamily II DNA or RNA helicase